MTDYIRAELAAEREKVERLASSADEANVLVNKLFAERDALRALLREALAHLKTGQWAVPTDVTLMSRIKAALNKGDGG